MFITFLKKHWPIISISLILVIILGFNFHPGKLVLSNDNFAPELDPRLTIIRSFLNPAWRDNRVLGIPSDSEQADVWRTLIFALGSQFLPTWIISQGYLFLTLVIGVISMGKAVRLLTNDSRTSEFFGSLFYLFSPITIWIYFYPVHLFLAAYAFTPLVLWMSLRNLYSPNRTNKLLLLLSSLLMGTTALTATMFITASLTIFTLTFIHSFTKHQTKIWFITLLIYLLPHLFWILPFSTYVKSNSDDLQNSAINREITTSTIASEQSNNTWQNTLRFSTAWIDSKEDDQNYTYQARSWFRENPLGIKLGYTLAILATLGLLISLSKPRRYFSQILIGIIGLVGFIFINGYNPPFSTLYSLFDQYIPLFHQVFRWSSSKFWPLFLYPLIILASLALSKIIHLAKNRLIQLPIILVFSTLIIYIAHPILSYRLIREEVFVSIPAAYTNLKNNLTNKTGAIDITPHTNTRYFRKYDWGFWGSVFLNYLLPNPTTEKALVIGSDENQVAFDTLDQSYNSQDQGAYASALSRYNITQVLSDQSVTNDGLGLSYAYPFDWDLHAQMITNNSRLTSTWQHDYLHLYKLTTPLSTQSVPLSPLHDPSILNKSLATIHNNDPYHYTSSGSIYPLSLKPNRVQLENQNLLTTTKLTTSNEYILNIPSSLFQSTPTLLSYDGQTLINQLYFPIISLNNNIIYQPPSATTPTTTYALTANDQRLFATSTLFSPDTSPNLQEWRKESQTNITHQLKGSQPIACNSDVTPNGTSQFDPTVNNYRLGTNKQSCFATDFNTTEDSLLTVKATLQADNPTLVDICIHSYLQNRCLNTPSRYLIQAEPITLILPSQYVTQKKDNIVIYFNVQPYLSHDISLTVADLTLETIYSSTPFTTPALPIGDTSTSIITQPGDQLTISYPLTSATPSLVPFEHFCPARGATNSLNQIKGIAFTTSNCIDGAYTPLTLNPSLGITSLLTYVNATNTQGIPLDYSLRRNDQSAKLAREYLATSNDPLYSFTILPQDYHNFTLEFNNISIGKIPTINSLNDFAAIPIPTSWLSLTLTPTTTNTKTIATLQPFNSRYSTGTYLAEITNPTTLYTLPTATSLYWRAVILSNKPRNLVDFYFQSFIHLSLHDKTLANGWQDAWNVNNQNQGKYIAVIFLPNVLAYLGLFIGLGTALVLVFVSRATKTVSTHKYE